MTRRLAVLMLLLTALPAWGQALPELDVQRVAQDHEALMALPHHLTGTEQGRAAGDLILAELAKAGLNGEQVLVLPFAVTQATAPPGQCYLQADGKRHEMTPVRPNGMALSVTPAEGITGPTMYLGDGRSGEAGKADLTGHIAVLDWDSGDAWQRAMDHGALAVIFIAPAQPTETGRLWTDATAPLPRFAVSAQTATAAGLRQGVTVSLHCRQEWRQGEGRNIIAIIPGSDQKLRGEAVALATHYDSYGVLPQRSASVRGSANVAALLETARWLAKHPQSRTTMVIFFDADTQGSLGQLMLQFTRSVTTGAGDAREVVRLLSDREQERGMLSAKVAVLKDPVAVLAGRDTSPVAATERIDLLRELEVRYNGLRDERMELLLERHELATTRPDVPTAAMDARIEQVSTQRQEMADLRRAAQAGQITDGVRPLLSVVIDQRRTDLESRIAENQRETDLLTRQEAVGEKLKATKLLAVLFADFAPAAVPWVLGMPAASPQTGASWDRANGRWGASGDRSALVFNAPVVQWMENLQADPQRGQRWPALAGALAEMQHQHAWQWDATATSHLVLTAGSPGVVWTGQGSGVEPAADVAALVTRSREMLDVFLQMASIAKLNQMLLPAPTAATRLRVPEWLPGQQRYRGNVCQRYGGGSVEAELPAGHAVVLQRPMRLVSAPTDPDTAWGYLTTATAYGTFEAVVALSAASSADTVQIIACLYDSQGSISAINQLHPDKGMATVTLWNNPGYFRLNLDNKIVMFDAQFVGLRDSRHPLPTGLDTEFTRYMQGLSNTPWKRLHVSMDREFAGLWLERLRPLKVIHQGMLLLGNSPQDPVGGGVVPEQKVVDVVHDAAEDTWTLNEMRLGRLRQYGIVQDSLERLHEKAWRLLEESREIGPRRPEASAARTLSLIYSSLIYDPVRQVTNDLVKAVVILLLLAIPFAFSIERLVFGSANIYRQIAAFVGTFLLVFAILYVAHPAFRFATFPVVVLLAFVIIIMSSLVIYIMWGRFEHEVKQMQGIATVSHRSTRSTRATLGAAVALGISTMRRRPMRTTLTAITIVLLTFTTLFFGALGSSGGVRRVEIGGGSERTQVEAELTGARTIDQPLLDAIREHWARQATVYSRQWGAGAGGALLTGQGPAGQVVQVEAWANLAPLDLELYPALRGVLDGDVEGFTRDGGLWLPAEMVRSLGLSPGDAVMLLGRVRVLRGGFDAVKIAQLRTVGGAAFVPPDLEQMRQQIAQQFPGDGRTQKQKMREMDREAFPLIDASHVALLWDADRPADVASTVVLVPRPGIDAAAIASDLATVLSSPVTLSQQGQAQRLLYTQNLSFSGWSDLVVPLLLGGLIIFSTMLSSVTDREREIFTFSAVGLAPVHVAVLFFAEAAVYAVIGGMGGYLFSQVFAKVVQGMAMMGWVTAPQVNYSSLNAMAAILIVMLTVVVSTIYPAIKASRSANPGIQRRWAMPAPVGDDHRLVFPFTVSEHDIRGLILFLEEYFQSNSDATVGAFAADHIAVERDAGVWRLSATVWLQPFDQGVSQTFTLRTSPSDIAGIDEVHLDMARLSGSPVIWRRSNMLFIDDIRQQFIFWRTIGDEVQEHYHKRSEQRFGVEQETT